MSASSVLFVDHASALGGAEMILLVIMARLDPDQWQPHLAGVEGALTEKAGAQGFPTHIVSLPRLRRSYHAPSDLLRGVSAVIQSAHQSQARLIVANTVRSAFYTALAAKLANIPFIWYRHDFWLGETPPQYPVLDNALKYLLCRSADRVIANSTATAQRHPCQDKIVTIHNGVDIERFQPGLGRDTFRQQYGIPQDEPVIGLLGRLSHVKGQETFLRIFARIVSERPDLWGLIVGGPIFGETAYAQNLHDMARTLGIEERLIFTGQLSDPMPSVAAMDIFVQTGEPEAFGLVNVEAMAMAKPVVAFDHGALPEIVINGQTGLLVQPGDEDALVGAVLKLLVNPNLCARMGKAGRERAMEHFSMDRVAAQISDLFRQVLE